MAVNRQYLAGYLYQGNAKLPNSVLPNFITGCSKDVKSYDYNVEEAKKLLVEAGYVNGFEFTAIIYSNPRPYNPVNGEKLAAAIQAAQNGLAYAAKKIPSSGEWALAWQHAI